MFWSIVWVAESEVAKTAKLSWIRGTKLTFSTHANLRNSRQHHGQNERKINNCTAVSI